MNVSNFSRKQLEDEFKLSFLFIIMKQQLTRHDNIFFVLTPISTHNKARYFASVYDYRST